MESNKAHKETELRLRCDEVLHYVWDPSDIAGVPEARDEYDGYVPSLFALLSDGADARALADFLLTAEEATGAARGPEVATKVAQVLTGWRERLRLGPMSEGDFWLNLEFRLCREMDKYEDCLKLGLWCDGIYPTVFTFGEAPAVIEGQAWIGFGMKGQELWSYRLLVPFELATRAQIEWEGLLPAEESTGWLTVNRAAKNLELDLRSAVPGE